MDKDKLADLRRRYADAKGGALYDPEFKRVSQTQFQGDRRKWPFMEPATFLSAPHRPNAAAESFADLDVALVGVPMDLGVTNRAGARLGPRAVRAVERIGPYEHVLRMTPAPTWWRPISATCRSAAASRSRAAMRTSRRISARSSGPACAARGRRRPLDQPRDPAGPSDASGRSAWSISTRIATRAASTRARSSTTADRSGRRCSTACSIPERTIQIGIRGGAEYLWEFSYVSGMTVIHAEEVARSASRR